MPCGHSAGNQGGQETIYRLPLSSSDYQVEIIAASGGIANYGWKYDSLGCSSSGWNCLGRTGSPITYNITNIDSCHTVLLLINSENNIQVNHTVLINCSISSCNPTGITETTLNNSFNLFPNPSKDKLTIYLSEQNNLKSSVSIINVLGAKLYQQNFSNQSKLTIDVSDFPSGIYFVQIANDKGKRGATKKFIKE